MKKVLFYGMNGEKMCFTHILLNALDLKEQGYEVKIIFEGSSVKLPVVFEREKFIHYCRAKELGLIAGVCYACSKMLGVLEENEQLNLPLLKDMNQHAGMKEYVKQNYEIVVF